MPMDKNPNENTISSLASVLKCVCATPEQLNVLAVMLAETLAKNSTKEEILKQVQFLQVLHTSLRSYL